MYLILRIEFQTSERELQAIPGYFTSLIPTTVSGIAAHLWQIQLKFHPLLKSLPLSSPLAAQNPAYLVNCEVPGGSNYVFSGAGEDGNVMVEDFGGIGEGGCDLEVEAVCGV